MSALKRAIADNKPKRFATLHLSSGMPLVINSLPQSTFQPVYNAVLVNNEYIDINSLNDKELTLLGGTIFVITLITFNNPVIDPGGAFDGEWWTGPGRTGNKLAFTGSSPIGVSQTYNYTLVPTTATIYFSLGTAFGDPDYINIYQQMTIYGTILD